MLGYSVGRKLTPSAKAHRLSPNDKTQIQVIARAAAVLRSLEAHPLGLSLGEIAKHVGLARSTVQRIVAALEVEKLVIAASPTGRVILGPMVSRLASAVNADLTAIARPYLVKLSEELYETVDLAAIKKDHLTFVDQVIGPQRLRAVSAVGETFPLHYTANGKAYLAELPEGEIEQLIGRSYEARTPNTLTRLDKLLSELRIVRKQGVAFDIEEHTLGICAAGIAVHDAVGNYYAISIPVPTARFHDRKKLIAKRLLATKAAMSEHLSLAA